MARTDDGDDETPSDGGRTRVPYLDTRSEVSSAPHDEHDEHDVIESAEVATEEPDDAPQRSSLSHNIGVLFGSQMVTWAVALATVAVIPRVLGPTAIGQFSLVAAVWIMVSMIATAGTSTVVTLEVARDGRAGGAVLGPVILARTGAFALSATGVAIYLVLSDASQLLVFVFVWMGIGAYIRNIGNVAREALQGFERLGEVARSEVITSTLAMVATLVLLLGFGQGLRAVVLVTASASVLQAVLLHRSLRPHYRIHPSLDFRAARTVLRRALPYFAGGVLVTVYHQIDVVIMAALVDDERIGWYSAADRLFGTALFVPTIVMSAVFPVLARLHTGDAENANALVSRAFRTLMVVGVPIGVGTMVLARPIAELLFGNDFSEAGPVLGVIGIVLMLTFQTVLFANYAVATGRERFIVKLMAVAIVMTVPLDLVLVPWTERVYGNGAIGGALSYVVTEFFILVACAIRLTPAVFSMATLVRLLRCSIAAGVMVAAVWPLRDVFPLVGVIVGAVAYLSVLLVQRPFDSEESAALSQLWKKIASRLPLSQRFLGVDQ